MSEGGRRARKRFVLTFEDEDRAGIEVRAKGTSLGKLMDLMDLADMPREDVKAEKERLNILFGRFMKCVEGWNLEHEDEETEEWVETPLTVDGLKEHEPDFVLDLVFAWMDGIVGTRGPLDEKSNVGEIPMDLP